MPRKNKKAGQPNRAAQMVRRESRRRNRRSTERRSK